MGENTTSGRRRAIWRATNGSRGDVGPETRCHGTPFGSSASWRLWATSSPDSSGDDEADDDLDAVVDGSPWVDAKLDAMRAHATQIDPAGAFLASPVADQQQAWPTEEFELARSRVETTLPEDDLFAGIDAGGEEE